MSKKTKISLSLVGVLFSFLITHHAQAASLGISGTKFTVGGAPKFLLMVSYFDAMAASNATLNLDFATLKTKGFDGVRIFPNWNPKDNPYQLMDSSGNLRSGKADVLKNIILKANANGLIVDVSFTRDTVSNLNVANYKKGITEATKELKEFNNIYFDIQNEADHDGTTCGGSARLCPSEAKSIRDAVKTVDPQRIVGVSTNSDSTAVTQYTSEGKMDFNPAHGPFNTFNGTGAFVKKEQGYTPGIPVHLQEPDRCRSSTCAYSVSQFLTSAKDAKCAAAAGWNFHTAAGYDLAGGSMFGRFVDPGVEKAVADGLSGALAGVSWGSCATPPGDDAAGIQGSCPAGYIELGESNASQGDITATSGYFCDDDAIPSSITGVTYPIKGDLYCSNKNPGSAFVIAGKYGGCNKKEGGRPGWSFDSAGKPHDSSGALIPLIGQNTCSSDQPVQVTVPDGTVSIGAWTKTPSKAGYLCIPKGNKEDDTDILLPPIPGDSSEVDATPGWAGNLAYNSTANNWLVVSQNNKNITGQLMSNDSKRIGAPIKITTTGENLAPRAGYAPNINKFLVVWLRENTPRDLTLYGQFVNPDGSMSGSPIQIDRGTYIFHANTSVPYDSKNKQFVIVWENRGNGVQVSLNTLSVSGKVGTRVDITSRSTNGIFNGAPSVAINEEIGQYCVMYQHVDDPVANTPSEVTVVPVSATSLQLGQPSILTKDAFFVYNIAYNSTDNNYLGIWGDYRGTGLFGKIFSGCKDDPNADNLVIGEIYHDANISYNSKSNSYAIIVQEAVSNNNDLYVIDSDGGRISDSALFTGGTKGNFGPRVAANTTTGLYAATSSEDYVITKFASNLGGSELLMQIPTAGKLPNKSNILPIPDKGLPTDLGQLIQAIFNWSLSLIGLVIFIQFFRAGIMWFTAGGNPGPIGKAKTIMTNALYGTAILFSAYLILNTINPDFVRSTFTLPGLPAGQGPDDGADDGPRIPPTSSTSCNQNFALAASPGCATTSSCVDVSSYTPSRGCESNGGICLLSAQAATRAKTFIASFNTLTAGKGCTLKLSSSIQGPNGPSVSQCHKPGNDKSGTCADFNILPNQTSCTPYFYQAARESGAVVSFLDEYVASCRPPSATGGNIHVNF